MRACYWTAVAALAALAGPVLAEPGVALPRVAYVKDPAGRLRPLHGVAGTFLLGAPALSGVRAFSAWGEEAAAVVDSRVLFFRNGRPVRELPAPGGRAVLGLDQQGEPAAVVFPEAASAAFRTREGWKSLPVRLPEGTILAAATEARGAVLVLAVRRPGGLWVIHQLAGRGLLLRQEWVAPNVSAACLLPGRTLLYAVEDRLVAQGPSGERATVPAGGEVKTLEPAGRGWIQIHFADGRSRIARIGADDIQVFHIPEAAR